MFEPLLLFVVVIALALFLRKIWWEVWNEFKAGPRYRIVEEEGVFLVQENGPWGWNDMGLLPGPAGSEPHKFATISEAEVFIQREKDKEKPKHQKIIKEL